MPAATKPARVTVDLDRDLAARLELVATVLGARGLDLATIVRALLVEAAESYEAQATRT